MRRFQLIRHIDESGVSGTGIVAEGVEFSNGWAAMTWLTQYSSIAFYPSMEYVQQIHGHGGKTEVHWLDDDDTYKCPDCGFTTFFGSHACHVRNG
jgi:hypothetical protein